MKLKYTTNKYLLLLAFSMSFLCGHSQEKGLTPAALDVLKQTQLWLTTDNASGIAFDAPNSYSDISIGYSKKHGTYHRPQNGDDASQVKVYTEGLTKVGKTYLWGDFSYSHTNVSDARFNASLCDPYRGQPFYVTDEHTSDWLDKSYHLAFKAATRPLGCVAFGLEGTYDVTLAAKQRDPRVDARYLKLGLKPAVSISLGTNDIVGANMEYASVKEESSMSREIYYVDHNYYEMYGLGNSVKGLGGERSTNYFGNVWGTGLQYGHHTASWNVISQIAWNRHVENVEIGYSTPEKEGLTDINTYKASVTVQHGCDKYLHEAGVDLSWRYNKVTQYFSQRDNSLDNAGWNVIFKNVRAKYRSANASLRYSLSRLEGDEYTWRVDADVTYRMTDDEFLLPHTTMDSENLYANLSFKNNFILRGSMQRRVLASVNVGLRQSMSGGYSYGGSQPDLFTVSTVMPMEAAFLTQDAWKAGTEITYSQLVKSGSTTHAWVKGSFDYYHGDSSMFNHLSNFSLTLGANF
ncbi:MAG: hypothetical protein K6E54_01500 [Bacteroidaceae bacterium]|nr:hypothetical protein [Bacteroidaceae bacterium]